MSIRIFVTGGTFEKEYDEISQKLVLRQTHWGDILKQGRSQLRTTITELMLVDSLEMTEQQREFIAQSCVNTDEKKIVITHGTDTMHLTAEKISALNIDKTVVLTGAMVPYSMGKSDAFFNMGASLAFAQTLPSGVYIAMNGKVFEWDKVQKNVEKGIFEKK